MDIKTTHKQYCPGLVISTMMFCLLFLVSGCNLLEWPAYVLFGQRTQKVKAQYSRLAGKKVALIVATGPGIDFSYPTASSNISLAVIAAIKGHVKDVEFVPYQKVKAFQDETLDWSSLPVDQITRRFSVQRILYLDTYQFTLAEISSVYLLRGRISAALRVYEAESQTPNIPVYTTEINVIYPKQGPLPMSDTSKVQVWRNTIGLFAKQLAAKFYTHKVDIQE